MAKQVGTSGEVVKDELVFALASWPAMTLARADVIAKFPETERPRTSASAVTNAIGVNKNKPITADSNRNRLVINIYQALAIGGSASFLSLCKCPSNR